MKFSECKGRNIWIICDQFLAKGPLLQSVLDHFDSSNKVKVFTNVIPDPPISVIAQRIIECGKLWPDRIIAFGRGSAIDTVKGSVYFARKFGVTACDNSLLFRS
ncbi:MAG: iron-containing alcohol dehydrogenase [Bacillus sp. (in: firmicutes)]